MKEEETRVDRERRAAGPAGSTASDNEPTPAINESGVEVRLTARLVTAIQNAVRGGLISFRDAHGDSIGGEVIHSAAKRSALQVWSVLKTHPDVSRVRGILPSELSEALTKCEAECQKKANMITRLRDDNQALRVERRALVDRIAALELFQSVGAVDPVGELAERDPPTRDKESSSSLAHPEQGWQPQKRRFTFDDHCEPCITVEWCAYHGKCLAESPLPLPPSPTDAEQKT